ncbi:MAG: DUF3784 domain-containing protein [Clostridiales bacterium]|nr:DUF3784 domain-containing protein [Clostridiales bacterium]
MLLFFGLATTALFIVLGFVFLCGKGAFLIAGYNPLSSKEEDKVDEAKLTKFMGKLMFALAACWLVVASSEVFQTMLLFWIGFGLFSITAIVGAVYANTRDRFRRH